MNHKLAPYKEVYNQMIPKYIYLNMEFQNQDLELFKVAVRMHSRQSNQIKKVKGILELELIILRRLMKVKK